MAVVFDELSKVDRSSDDTSFTRFDDNELFEEEETIRFGMLGVEMGIGMPFSFVSSIPFAFSFDGNGIVAGIVGDERGVVGGDGGRELVCLPPVVVLFSIN